MLTLDHLTVIAPTLAEGAAHVRDCLDLDVSFAHRPVRQGAFEGVDRRSAARLRGFSLEHHEAGATAALLRELGTERGPVVSHGPELRYRAQIETPGGLKELS